MLPFKALFQEKREKEKWARMMGLIGERNMLS